MAAGEPQTEASQPLDLPLEVGFGRGRVLDRGRGDPQRREGFWGDAEVLEVEREEGKRGGEA